VPGTGPSPVPGTRVFRRAEGSGEGPSGTWFRATGRFFKGGRRPCVGAAPRPLAGPPVRRTGRREPPGPPSPRGERARVRGRTRGATPVRPALARGVEGVQCVPRDLTGPRGRWWHRRAPWAGPARAADTGFRRPASRRRPEAFRARPAGGRIL